MTRSIRRKAPSPVARQPRPTHQERSQRTFEQILAAAEELLQERPFEELGIKEICSAAGCTTGAFYSRFDRKDDLLPYLYGRYDAALQPRVLQATKELVTRATTLRSLVRASIALVVTTYRRDRWIMRAFTLYARQNREFMDPETRSRRRATHELTLQPFLRFSTEIAHPDPESAVRNGLYFAMSSARERVLFSEAPHASVTPLGDAELIEELSHMLYAYLTTSPLQPSR